MKAVCSDRRSCRADPEWGRRGFECGMAFHDAGLGLIDGTPEGQAVRAVIDLYRLNLPVI